MSVLDRYEKERIRDLLGKGWLTHDGMWFFNVYQQLGVEKANAINKAAIQSLAPIEMSRARKNLDWDTQVKLALDPERTQNVHNEQHATSGSACSMCGKFCAMELVREYLGITAAGC